MLLKITDASCPSRMYGLPKVHKKGLPLQPVVRTVGSSMYALFKYLSGLLEPWVGNS